MEDLKNKDELKNRIKLCLDDLNYAINEQFYKRTLRMMMEYIEQTDSQIASLQEELKTYKDVDDKGLFLKLPCKPGDTIYLLKYWVGDWKIEPYTVKTLDYVLQLIEHGLIGELAFLTPEEAERELKNRQK